MDVVYAMASGHVGGPDGLMIMVVKGSHWPATDPVVLDNRKVFSTDPRWGLSTSVPASFDEPTPEPEPAPARRRAGAAA